MRNEWSQRVQPDFRNAARCRWIIQPRIAKLGAYLQTHADGCRHLIQGLCRLARNGGSPWQGFKLIRRVLRDVFRSTGLASAVTDRKGASLNSGGDLAIPIVARQFEWECWCVPALRVEHILPTGRMEKAYLLRLYGEIGRRQAATRCLYDWKAHSLLAGLIGAKDFARWVRGALIGPWEKLRGEHACIAGDVHVCQQRQVCGRAMGSLAWPK